MLGSTRTELTSSAQPADFSLTEAAMRSRVRGLIGDHTDTAIQVYSKANPGATPSDLYFLIASDYRYSGPVMKIAERRAALGSPVFLYYFRWETPVDGGRLKSPHTIEIPFAFDNVKAATRLTGGGPEAMALADKVSDTWIAFAKTGSPDTTKLPRWTPFNAKDRPTMVFNNESRVENDPIREQRLVMFKALGYDS
jgi:para-nitrobenzyl esterase